MKINDIDYQTKSVDIFKEMSPEKIEALKKLFTSNKYRKGVILTKPGERGKVFIVKSGRIELYENFTNGKRFIYSILGRGRIFGDFDFEIPPVVYTRTIEDSEICEINSKVFMTFLLNEPKLLLKLFQYFYIRLLIIQKKIASSATEDVFHRLVKLLLSLGRPHETAKFSQMITDKFTHEQISQMLGVSRQTVTTMLGILQKKGLIQKRKKSFMYDKEKLEKFNE